MQNLNAIIFILLGILFVYISSNIVISRRKTTLQSRIYFIAAGFLIYMGINRLGLFDNYIQNENFKFLAIIICTFLFLVIATFLIDLYLDYWFKKKRFK